MMTIESKNLIAKDFYGFFTQNTQYVVKRIAGNSELDELQHINAVVSRLIAALLAEQEQNGTLSETEAV